MKRKKDKSGSIDATIGVSTTQNVGKYGHATGEYIKGYRGEVGPEGEILRKGLKQVAESKVNPDFEYQNIKQQAGFSAEIHYVDKENADSIINDTKKTIYRSNDIGRGNDPIYDVLSIDENGDPTWGAQMKFCGRFETSEQIQISSKNIVNKLASPKWERYRGNKVLIPKEQYFEAKKYAEDTSKEYQNQADKFRMSGDVEKADMLDKKASVYNQISIDLQDSGITSKEALFLREHPKLATAKYVIETSNLAGIENAKCAAIMSGSISVAQNVVSVMMNKKDANEAIFDVGEDIIKGSATGYIIGFSDSVVRGFMKSSQNSVFVNLSKTNVPAMIATATVQVGKSLIRFANGEIDSLELIEELGEKGTGMMAASFGAAVGTAILPGIGTLIGGMVGYMTSSTIYSSCMQVLNQERLSYEKRKMIHQLAETAIKSMTIQGNELLNLTKQFYGHRQEIFQNSILSIEKNIREDNVENVISSLNNIIIEMGGNLKFKNFGEFDSFMMDSETVFSF